MCNHFSSVSFLCILMILDLVMPDTYSHAFVHTGKCSEVTRQTLGFEQSAWETLKIRACSYVVVYYFAATCFVCSFSHLG